MLKVKTLKISRSSSVTLLNIVTYLRIPCPSCFLTEGYSSCVFCDGLSALGSAIKRHKPSSLICRSLRFPHIQLECRAQCDFFILKPWIFDEFSKHDNFECTGIGQTTAHVRRLVCEELSPSRNEIITTIIIWPLANSCLSEVHCRENINCKGK
jgi:hypothetical protein